MELMDEFNILQEKIKSMDRENYILRQSGAGISNSRSDTGASYGNMSDAQKTKYEERIKVLE